MTELRADSPAWDLRLLHELRQGARALGPSFRKHPIVPLCPLWSYDVAPLCLTKKLRLAHTVMYSCVVVVERKNSDSGIVVNS